MAYDDEPPSGPPPGWADDVDSGAITLTHYCDRQFWVDRYGEQYADWVRWYCCFAHGTPQFSCPGGGGEP